MKFAILGNTYQTKKSVHLESLLTLLKKYNAEIYIYNDFYKFIVSSTKIPLDNVRTFTVLDFSVDMIICMGGDGTFLKAASFVGNRNIPILGINTGRLGFLADISPNEIQDTIKDIFSNNYRIEERSVLNLVCQDKTIKGYPFGLNEIAVLKRDSSSMITIHTSINGNYLTTYQADGLVISTPTGSTAYSLSVGGPIIVPHSNTIAITPVAPHSLNVRPIVINDDWEITLDVESRSHNFLVAIDGRSETCAEGSQLKIKKADYTIKVVKRTDHVFFKTLRDKMMWGADGRA